MLLLLTKPKIIIISNEKHTKKTTDDALATYWSSLWLKLNEV